MTELEQVALALAAPVERAAGRLVRPHLRHRFDQQHARDRRRARSQPTPSRAPRGARPGLVVYTSEQAHSSIEKGAIAVGIGQDYVRKIAVDDEFRMRPDVLRQAIEQDLAAGCGRAASSATVGTTSTTSVDPVPAIADFASGTASGCTSMPRTRGRRRSCRNCAGHSRAASAPTPFVTNPHKWLLTPMDCSVFYTRRPEVLRRAFSLVPEYLQTADDPRAINLMDYGVPLGRRFRALKLWFVLRSFGREGLAAVIRGHMRWPRIRRWVDADPVLRADRARAVLGRELPVQRHGRRESRHPRRVNATGEVFLSGTVLRGRFTMRLAIGNLGTRPENLARAWEIVNRVPPDYDVVSPHHVAHPAETPRRRAGRTRLFRRPRHQRRDPLDAE